MNTPENQLHPLTRRQLWQDFREYRRPGGGKNLFLSLGDTDFLSVGIGTWEGPRMSLFEGSGISFPLVTGSFFPVEFARMSREVRPESTLGKLGMQDVRLVIELLGEDRHEDLFDTKGEVRQHFSVTDTSGMGLSEVSMRMMPLPRIGEQVVSLDDETNDMPLAVTLLTDGGYPAMIDKIVVPAMPLPVFVETN